MNKPYVGVTGAVFEEEVKAIVDSFERNGLTMNGSHVPMSGLLVSYQTLDSRSKPGNKRHPKLEDIPSLLRAHGNKAFTTIHFNTRRPETLSKDISSIFELEGIYEKGLCRGLQLNIAWPPNEEVNEIKSKYPDMKIILQLSKRATEGLSLEEIVLKTATYLNADYVLVDPSGGKGLEFDAEYSATLYKRLKGGGVKATIGFAGGLSGNNVAGITKDMRERLETAIFSIDAEGNLRDKLTPAYGDDVMNLEKVGKYISESAKGFS
jgi:hypothetical protein